jgi:hypothetical protein
MVSNGGLIRAPQVSLATPATSVAKLKIASNGSVEAGGLRVAEDAGSRGMIDISNGRLTSHSVSGPWIIGVHGDAVMSIQKAGQALNLQGFGVMVAQGVTSTAKIKLADSGSLLDAGPLLGLGWDLHSNSPGGICEVTLNAGAVMRADEIIVGPRCIITGDGVLEGLVTNNGGTISPSLASVAVVVPANASGFFGSPSAGATDFVLGYSFSEAGEQVALTTTGTIRLVSPLMKTDADGATTKRRFIIGSAGSAYLPLEEAAVDAGIPVPITDGHSKIDGVGALIGAFVAESTAAQPTFAARDEDAIGLGQIGITSGALFLIGTGPFTFTAPGPGRLYLGINEPFVSNNDGAFNVSIAEVAASDGMRAQARSPRLSGRSSVGSATHSRPLAH